MRGADLTRTDLSVATGQMQDMRGEEWVKESKGKEKKKVGRRRGSEAISVSPRIRTRIRMRIGYEEVMTRPPGGASERNGRTKEGRKQCTHACPQFKCTCTCTSPRTSSADKLGLEMRRIVPYQRPTLVPSAPLLCPRLVRISTSWTGIASTFLDLHLQREWPNRGDGANRPSLA